MKTLASYFRIIIFAILAFIFLYWIDSNDDTNIFSAQPLTWLIWACIILFYIAGEVCIESLKSLLYQSLDDKAKANYHENKALVKANRFKWFKEKYKASLGSKAIEEEHEIILDHNYDGIKELDNNLPPWWVYMFYGTIAFAAIYLIRFEVFNDYTQDKEYEIAVAEAKIKIEAWKKTAKNLVDVNTVTLLTEASDLKAGQTIYSSRCIACHKIDGGGGIGPNLTDEYWILGGGIKNVFNTVSEGGRDGKGMVPWKTELKPAEIAQVSSYLLSFQGTTPAEPKVAEGNIWIDPNAPKEVTLEINESVND